MKTVTLDIETIPDEAAMARAGYEPGEDYAPWPLHQLACASLLVVETSGTAGLSFRIRSVTRDDHGERGIVEVVERELGTSAELITFNGAAHDLPILLARGLLGGVAMPAIGRFATGTVMARHGDLMRELKVQGAPPTSLKHLCAPLQIPVKQSPHDRVASLAAQGNWAAVARYCEADVIATWVAAQLWRSTADPELGRQRWDDLAAWIAAEQPRLAHLTLFVKPAAWPGAGGVLGDTDAIVL